MTTRNITADMQADIVSFMRLCEAVQLEAADIYKMYWSTDVNTDISALATGTTAATDNTNLNKTQFTNGVTLAEQLDKFFTNQALAQADYIATINGLLYGNTNRSTTPVHTEKLGDRLYSLAGTALAMFKSGREIYETYFDSLVSAVVSGVNNDTIIFGSDMTKAELVNGITLIENFRKLLNNEVATQADYGSTVSLWRRL